MTQRCKERRREPRRVPVTLRNNIALSPSGTSKVGTLCKKIQEAVHQSIHEVRIGRSLILDSTDPLILHKVGQSFRDLFTDLCVRSKNSVSQSVPHRQMETRNCDPRKTDLCDRQSSQHLLQEEIDGPLVSAEPGQDRQQID